MHISSSTVKQWIANDPSEEDRSELSDLLKLAEGGDEEAQADLDDRFAGELEFGTAGLRGHLGAGPNRMNRAVVIRAAAGLCAYLQEKVGADFSLVVGFDARYGSAQFAQDTAAVATALGGKAFLFPRALPTPVTAFALRHLEVDAAVMVTASHNPPEDNGYKVYLGGRAVTDWGQGSQIVPPADKEIYAKIQAAGPAKDIALADSGWQVLGEDVLDAYLKRLETLVPACSQHQNLRIVLTSMHGVGGETCLRALHQAGFSDVHIVTQQHDPDPDFPTVSFPNPEEPGALDLSMQLAQAVDADLILANDPDADRCSAAICVAGKWRQLAGDEVGWLLGEQAAASGKKGVLASSIVSSRLLGEIAKHHGLSWHPTLTGFKWISRVPELLFGYEEALGYCVDPAFVRDKDGISACLKLASLASSLKACGKTLQSLLDELALRHGLYATSPLTVRVEDLSIITQAMATFRKNGLKELAHSPVVEVADLEKGYGELPPTNAMLFRTQDNSRVVARPSGTEPKLKCYLEVVVPLSAASELPQARKVAAERLEDIKKDLRQVLGL